MNLLLSFLLLTSSFSCSDNDEFREEMIGGGQKKNVVNIIPLPQYLSIRDGSFELKEEVTVGYSAELQIEVDKFAEFIHSDHGMNMIDKGKSQDVDIFFELATSGMQEKHPDEYSIESNNGKIVARSKTSIGIFYSMQTIRQMINKYNDKFTVQNLAIADYPAHEWRSVMLDEARYFKGKESVKKILYEMSRLKMNKFHWHLTDDQGWRIEIMKYPKLIEIGSKRDSTQINDGPDWPWVHNKWDGKPHSGHYTQAEIKEIIKYAEDLHISIIPEIEILTHSTAAIASYPWLGTTGKEIKVACNLGVMHEVMNIADQRVVDFVHDVLDETSALFPSQYIHVGGDELMGPNWAESTQIQELKNSLGITEDAELQLWYFNNISHYLASKGKTMVAWSDFIGKPNVKSNIPVDVAEGTIAQYWQGDINDLNYCLKNGLKVIQSHTDFAYFNAWLPDAYKNNVVVDGANPEYEGQIIGLGSCLWGEFDSTVERMEDHAFPRIAAYAETAWTKAGKKDYESFKIRMNPLYRIWEGRNINVGSAEESR